MVRGGVGELGERLDLGDKVRDRFGIRGIEVGARDLVQWGQVHRDDRNVHGNAIALTVFSVVLVVLALICSALWRAHVRGLSVTFAIVAALAVVSLVASLV